ncbi:Endonuclease/exonuclease/phosphatase [Gossypium australe]|uniref:Endonuclease/exonuclease/phosphatase n=1 Tax=Gossypium australe TaxID=47621 RepID=A0A5B6WIN5_9ROSI|nr:Endonuclease/exonuclease/phosphatase [Gossypium australe]
MPEGQSSSSKRPFCFLAGWVEHPGFSKFVKENWKVELETREELESVLHHEELLWRQKARCDWLIFGDPFFHKRTLQRKKHNCIAALKNQVREWVMDEEELKKTGSLGGGAFPILEQKEIQFLSMPIFYEEIKKAVFDMAPLKAPESDGLHTFFYQS